MQSATVQNVERAPAHLTATILGMWQLNPGRYFIRRTCRAIGAHARRGTNEGKSPLAHLTLKRRLKDRKLSGQVQAFTTCGFEIKNRGFTGFSAGGRKGLWFSRLRRNDNRLVFCESAIDALSYAVLFGDARTRYTSIGGQVSFGQRELIEAAIAHMPAGSTIDAS